MAIEPTELALERLGMSREEYEKVVEDDQMECVCKQCPTYVEGDERIAYCYEPVGQSDVITEERNCICGQCPVYQKNGWRLNYYCTRGAEMTQTLELVEEFR